MIGRYPTPAQRLSRLSTARAELWVKRDDLTSDVYGGNKVRKLEYILENARSRRARRLVTFGTAGSHHVLATAIHGRRAGFEVAAILTPQFRTEHAVNNLRAALAEGLTAFPASSIATAPLVLARVASGGDMLVAPGGSSVAGAMGYADAAFELEAQVRAGVLPSPDAIVVALGSAGTAAGLLAGVVASTLRARVVAVRVVSPVLMGKQRVLSLALRTAARRGLKMRLRDSWKALELESDFLGAGYGRASDAGDRATSAAKTEGLVLDPTYTAKTFAAALHLVESTKFERVLYWHTLSSASLAPILQNAPALPRELDRLFIE